MHEELYEVFEKLCDELKEYGQADLSMEHLKTIDTLAHAAKNVLKIMECEDGGSYDDGSYRGSYYGNRSYRMSHKRDSMGRYSREGNTGSYEGVSNRYSRSSNNVTDGLRELMNAAPPEMQGEINRLIKKLDNM